jgi:phage terminase large subunit-like protein
MDTATPKSSKAYTKFFKNGDKKSSQLLPLPVRKENKVVGFKWTKVNLVDVLNMTPSYSPFLNADDFYFDLDEFEKLTNFIINECVYPEGELSGLPFIPELWQWCIFLNMFCWKNRKTNRRRYREVFIYVPRKNGKTSAFGVIPSLYMIYCDPEQRSQNFCCAADLEQAGVNFRHVAYNIERNPRLLGRLIRARVNKHEKFFETKSGNTFKVLSSIADTKHGLSPNFVYVDEVHAHKDGELIDVMVTGTAGRPQPLIVYTTTADFDRPSVCNDMHSRARKIAQGYIIDNAFYPVIYEAEVNDDFKDEAVWRKANPNFGISIYPEFFLRQIQVCQDSPTNLNRFLRLHLNIRTKTETVWIPPWVWANGNAKEDPLLTVDQIKEKLLQFRFWHSIANTKEFYRPTIDVYINEYRDWYTWYFRKLEELRDSPCWGGYDNSASSDIAAFVLFFPDERCVLPWFWVPGESIERRSKEERVPYEKWYKAGIINNTPLARISEIDISTALVGDHHNTGITAYFTHINNVAFDRWNSNYIYEILYNNGIRAEGYPQGFAGMNEPCRKLETMITNKELFHGSNPVLDWMNNNAMATSNNNNQMRVDKKKSTDKVDGLVALLTAIGGYIHTDSNIIQTLPGLAG